MNGYLEYASLTLKQRHFNFYNNKLNLYLVKNKYLDAFGKKVFPQQKEVIKCREYE